MIRALLLLLLTSKNLLLNQLSMRIWGCGNQPCLVGAAPPLPSPQSCLQLEEMVETLGPDNDTMAGESVGKLGTEPGVCHQPGGVSERMAGVGWAPRP